MQLFINKQILDDGNHTFYIDAVKEEVSRTSTSDKRYPITENDCIKEIFGKVKV